MLENQLKRIADSLEIIAGVLDDKAVQSFAAGVPLPVEIGSAEHKDIVEEVPAPTPIVDKEQLAPKPAAPPIADAPAPVTEAPAPVTEAPAAAQMTLDHLNTSLIAEFHRLGGRDLIDGVIKGYGVNTATELSPSDYQAVLDKVRAL